MAEKPSTLVVLLACEGLVRSWRRIGLMTVTSTWRAMLVVQRAMERNRSGGFFAADMGRRLKSESVEVAHVTANMLMR